MRWCRIAVLGGLAICLSGCPEWWTRQSVPLATSTSPRDDNTVSRPGDPPTPSLFQFRLGIPSE